MYFKADHWLTPSCEGSVEYELPGKGIASIVFLNPFGFLRSHFVTFSFAAGSGNGAGVQVKGKFAQKVVLFCFIFVCFFTICLLASCEREFGGSQRCYWNQ
jgi:hypothetical protein